MFICLIYEMLTFMFHFTESLGTNRSLLAVIWKLWHLPQPGTQRSQNMNPVGPEQGRKEGKNLSIVLCKEELIANLEFIGKLLFMAFQ